LVKVEINLRLILTEVGITGPKPKDWRSKAKKPDNSDKIQPRVLETPDTCPNNNFPSDLRGVWISNIPFYCQYTIPLQKWSQIVLFL